MARSVSVPHNALVVAYRAASDDECADDLDYLRDWIKELFPAASACDYWIGREDYAICENGLVYFGVSEYCGLMSVWITPKDGKEGLAERWAGSVEDKFKNAFSEYNLVGRFSNGEAVYSRRDA